MPPLSVNEPPTFPLQAQRSSEPAATMQNHAMHPFGAQLQSGYAHHDAALTGYNQPIPVSAAPTGLVSPMGPPARPRKHKAATLHAKDWEPHKQRILDLYYEQKRPLSEVRQMIEGELGFKAGLRQYQSRISQWRKDKNVKPQEMQVIVRKRQKRRLVETNKRPLKFKVRGSEVELKKIERWMNRHNVADSFLYAPSPTAPTPSDVGCHTMSERGSPTITTPSTYSPTALVLSPAGVYLTAQSPQMPSPALSVSSIVRLEYSAFAGQSPAPTRIFLPTLQDNFVYDPSTSRSNVDGNAQTRYRGDEEERLRNQILLAETTFTINSLETSNALHQLADVLLDQGRYRAAEDVARRILEIHRGQSGSIDSNTATLSAQDLLGRVLRSQGLYFKSERLLRRVLQEKKNVLGHEHPDTLVAVGNLASVLERQGKYADAGTVREGAESRSSLYTDNYI